MFVNYKVYEKTRECNALSFMDDVHFPVQVKRNLLHSILSLLQ